MTILLIVFQTEMFQPENVLKFAHHLYAEEDFSGALNEYRRYIFIADSVQQEIYERIIDCLIKLERFNEAIKETARIDDIDKRNYTKGWVYFSAGRFDSSRIYLDLVKAPYYISDARRLIGLGYAHQFNFNEASSYILMSFPKPKYKSATLGGLFALFPGGGHFYCGRIEDGIYSFFVVGTASALTYYYYNRKEDLKFGIALGVSILFYAGNIYGGINAVRNYNYYQNLNYLNKVIEVND